MLKIVGYIIIGLIVLVGLIYIGLQLWFWTINYSENKNHLKEIKKLGLENFKFKKTEQFDFLDGKVSGVDLLKKYNINASIPITYFIDIDKLDYVEHLESHPPNKWFNDGISYNIIEKTADGYYDHSYIKGKRVGSKHYKTFTELLDMIANFRMMKE